MTGHMIPRCLLCTSSTTFSQPIHGGRGGREAAPAPRIRGAGVHGGRGGREVAPAPRIRAAGVWASRVSLSKGLHVKRARKLVTANPGGASAAAWRPALHWAKRHRGGGRRGHTTRKQKAPAP
jgi:hypothetical protein